MAGCFDVAAVFSRLEAFLPVMAEENKKLSEAVAAGEGAKHNIEVEEAEEQSGEDGDDVMAGGDEKKDSKIPVIEMVRRWTIAMAKWSAVCCVC